MQVIPEYKMNLFIKAGLSEAQIHALFRRKRNFASKMSLSIPNILSHFRNIGADSKDLWEALMVSDSILSAKIENVAQCIEVFQKNCFSNQEIITVFKKSPSTFSVDPYKLDRRLRVCVRYPKLRRLIIENPKNLIISADEMERRVSIIVAKGDEPGRNVFYKTEHFNEVYGSSRVTGKTRKNVAAGTSKSNVQQALTLMNKTNNNVIHRGKENPVPAETAIDRIAAILQRHVEVQNTEDKAIGFN